LVNNIEGIGVKVAAEGIDAEGIDAEGIDVEGIVS
jgi:hypothetical protein